jgi:twitching motility protein PilT
VTPFPTPALPAEEGVFSHDADPDRALVQLPDVARRLLDQVESRATGEERLNQIVEIAGLIDRPTRQQIRDAFEPIAARMIDLDASDVDAGGSSANERVWYRVQGAKRPYPEMGRLSLDQTDLLFLSILNERQRAVLRSANSVDFSYELPFSGRDGRARRFRGTIYYDQDRLALNLRAITDQVRALRSLDFSPQIERGLLFRFERDGLTLITGVTGSGKSNTLDAIVNANNVESEAHIVVIGKPIEFVHASRRSIVRHREVGKDVPTFKDGIVQALRQDPDIIVIGEMRDPETISAALEITDSGHKVFSTLHTSSAVESIDRILGEYPANEQDRIRLRLADVLRCVVSQKLCPGMRGGRVLAKEVLWMTPAARAAIKNANQGEIYQMMWEGQAQGMTTLEQDLFRLVRAHRITPETAYSYANNKRRLQQLLG